MCYVFVHSFHPAKRVESTSYLYILVFEGHQSFGTARWWCWRGGWRDWRWRRGTAPCPGPAWSCRTSSSLWAARRTPETRLPRLSRPKWSREAVHYHFGRPRSTRCSRPATRTSLRTSVPGDPVHWPKSRLQRGIWSRLRSHRRWSLHRPLGIRRWRRLPASPRACRGDSRLAGCTRTRGSIGPRTRGPHWWCPSLPEPKFYQTYLKEKHACGLAVIFCASCIFQEVSATVPNFRQTDPLGVTLGGCLWTQGHPKIDWKVFLYLIVKSLKSTVLKLPRALCHYITLKGSKRVLNRDLKSLLKKIIIKYAHDLGFLLKKFFSRINQVDAIKKSHFSLTTLFSIQC